ncbi:MULTISPECIES: helix-turn-helix transcriptional regulator [Bradyrhizobium]|uniref:helix-turn-helix transcriptional regulator n=1 Tax=Bradyrhizobium TaxID=374 RepID=UPI001EDC883A|nr:helix-turn-helix domain-containing protein [Bradyrhizobium zhengyangense]MCG2639424.1 helix-turn-helix domain-containing protein [Bradyrhizobium zhengyangense]
MTALERRTAEAAAHYLDVSPATLAKWRISGEGPKFARIGKRVCYFKEDLDAWMLDRRVTSTAEMPSTRRPNAGRKKTGEAA